VEVAGDVVLTYKVLDAEVFWMVSILDALEAARSVAEDVPTELLLMVMEPDATCEVTDPIKLLPAGRLPVMVTDPPPEPEPLAS